MAPVRVRAGPMPNRFNGYPSGEFKVWCNIALAPMPPGGAGGHRRPSPVRLARRRASWQINCGTARRRWLPCATAPIGPPPPIRDASVQVPGKLDGFEPPRFVRRATTLSVEQSALDDRVLWRLPGIACGNGIVD